MGGEGGKVHLHNLDTKHLVYEFDTKTNRSVAFYHDHTSAGILEADWNTNMIQLHLYMIED